MSLTAIVFLVAFATACVLALVRHPIYGLGAYVATLYFDPAGQWWGQGAIQEVRWEFLPAIVTLVAMFLHGKRTAALSALHSGPFWGFVAYVGWVAIQSSWALDPVAHRELLTIWVKFLIVTIMISGCIDSWSHFRLFLWLNVVGSFYLGWLSYTEYSGGRFQGFGGGSFGEANAGALELVIGLVIAATLFLGGRWRTRTILLPPIAIIANGIVTTISRSGFLAALASLFTFNIFAPRSLRWRVGFLSAAAVVLFLSLTTTGYWNRMQTIKYEGADLPGIDTGGGRLDILYAQWRIFEEHPLGCGAMCTTVLSPQFVPEQYLSGGPGGQRASHNTFMSMLVDQGIPGGILYLALLLWTYVALRRATKALRRRRDFPAIVLPGLAAVMVAITVADLFVEYTRLEARVWFVGLLITHARLVSRDAANARRAAITEPPVASTLSAPNAYGPVRPRALTWR